MMTLSRNRALALADHGATALVALLAMTGMLPSLSASAG